MVLPGYVYGPIYVLVIAMTTLGTVPTTSPRWMKLGNLWVMDNSTVVVGECRHGTRPVVHHPLDEVTHESCHRSSNATHVVEWRGDVWVDWSLVPCHVQSTALVLVLLNPVLDLTALHLYYRLVTRGSREVQPTLWVLNAAIIISSVALFVMMGRLGFPCTWSSETRVSLMVVWFGGTVLTITWFLALYTCSSINSFPTEGLVEGLTLGLHVLTLLAVMTSTWHMAHTAGVYILILYSIVCGWLMSIVWYCLIDLGRLDPFEATWPLTAAQEVEPTVGEPDVAVTTCVDTDQVLTPEGSMSATPGDGQ